MVQVTLNKNNNLTNILPKNEILDDYKLALISRQLSIVGRKEVHTGKAKFGIFGDGMEIAQIAYAKCFKNGDWRAGYYRDQTFMLAIGALTAEEFFAQLYGDTNETNNPSSSGRHFNNSFSTKNINSDGSWINLTTEKNSSSDISPTGGQMPRLLGLAYASKLFRNIEQVWQYNHLSNFGNEVAFGTIGDASTSEGVFFETINAACVLQVPLAVAVWDNGFGISVPIELQTAKSSISEALKGFKKETNSNGCEIYTCRGWNYIEMIEVFAKGIEQCRKTHIPVIFHVKEMNQPLGHSTSGSHERYKSKERLQWEEDFDSIKKMREWILSENISDEELLKEIELEAIEHVKKARDIAWNNYAQPYLNYKAELLEILNQYENYSIVSNIPEFEIIQTNQVPTLKDLIAFAKKALFLFVDANKNNILNSTLIAWIKQKELIGKDAYNTKVFSENKFSVKNIITIKPIYSNNAEWVNGRDIINSNFDYLFQKYPLLVTFGEDTGKIGDVNQGLRGLQQKYGSLRVTDTGIREATIIGQGLGLALRGFKPIAEIQYLDYLLYAISTISDDLATTHYRTKGQQSAPLIIRTRGHRLVGPWHSGSPMSMIINSARGIHLCVPRNMTQAAGFYNTLLESNDPAMVIEPIKGYEVKELLPQNIGEFKIALGEPEIITEGTNVTLVTYGWCVNVALEAVKQLNNIGISVELIDVQTLMPFDVNHAIKKSVEKTNHILFVDEDLPGGATAYMLQKVIEEQKAFFYLDAPPRTLTSQEHRPAYGTDGDYFSKPNAETIFEAVYNMMHHKQPNKFVSIM